MKVKCSRCGYEDEGNFCSHCGSPLSEVSSLAKQEIEAPQHTFWFERCPVCKLDILVKVIKEKFWGLSLKKGYECKRCGAVFIQKRERFYLTDLSDKSSLVWQKYKGQGLTEAEWKRVIYKEGEKTQRQRDIDCWIDQIKQGNISIEITGESPVILKKKEKLELVLPNIFLFEPRAVKRGVYGGPSFRIAKGVYFRLGGLQAESHEELREIDQGIITLTNKRFVFSGLKRTLNVSLKDIVSVEPYEDGIGLRRAGKERVEYFKGLSQVEFTIVVQNRRYKELLSGLILVYIIQGLIKKIE
jgi:hypothetical protein